MLPPSPMSTGNLQRAPRENAVSQLRGLRRPPGFSAGLVQNVDCWEPTPGESQNGQVWDRDSWATGARRYGRSLWRKPAWSSPSEQGWGAGRTPHLRIKRKISSNGQLYLQTYIKIRAHENKTVSTRPASLLKGNVSFGEFQRWQSPA